MTKVNQLASEIAKEFSKFTNQVEKNVDEIKKDVGKKAVATLKEVSPKDQGRYAKGWRLKKDGKTMIIHNTTSYQLTHLLEHGHANTDGTRTQAIPHIGKVEEEVIQEYVDRVEKAIKG